jgi:hypothetical protein
MSKLNPKNPFYKYLSVEDKEHIRVVEYLQNKYPNIIFTHVPAEGRKSQFERYKASLMGTRKGIADFIIFHPKSKLKKDGEGQLYNELHYYGLLIELKAPEHNRVVLKGKNTGKIVKAKGKLSPEQLQLLNRLSSLKYKAVCCFGFEEAIKVIDEYFKK